MSGKDGKGNPNISYKGINTEGNEYTVYNDGKFAYKNLNQQTGKPESSYYNAGKGHSFYQKFGPDGYSFHENQNKSYRNYKDKSGNK